MPVFLPMSPPERSPSGIFRVPSGTSRARRRGHTHTGRKREREARPGEITPILRPIGSWEKKFHGLLSSIIFPEPGWGKTFKDLNNVYIDYLIIQIFIYFRVKESRPSAFEKRGEFRCLSIIQKSFCFGERERGQYNPPT